MEDNIKYFQPDISDIRIGYELEINWNRGYETNWIPIKITVQDDDFAYTQELSEIVDALDDGMSEARVPYLTKEQIEAEGWLFQGKSIDTWFYKEGDFEIGSINTSGIWTSYKIVIHYGFHDKRLFINADDQGTEHKLFEGNCRCINDFRYIMKLLGISK